MTQMSQKISQEIINVDSKSAKKEKTEVDLNNLSEIEKMMYLSIENNEIE